TGMSTGPRAAKPTKPATSMRGRLSSMLCGTASKAIPGRVATEVMSSGRLFDDVLAGQDELGDGYVGGLAAQGRTGVLDRPRALQIPELDGFAVLAEELDGDRPQRVELLALAHLVEPGVQGVVAHHPPLQGDIRDLVDAVDLVGRVPALVARAVLLDGDLHAETADLLEACLRVRLVRAEVDQEVERRIGPFPKRHDELLSLEVERLLADTEDDELRGPQRGDADQAD